MPHLLFQIALLIVVVRSAYMSVTLLQKPGRNWLDILFYASVTYIGLAWLL